MATTAIFAELLIVGLEATAWLTLLILDVAGTMHTGGLHNYAALLTVAVLAVSYVLGILVDRIADSMFRSLEGVAFGTWLNRRFGESSLTWRLPAPRETMRFSVMHAGGGIASFLEYQRSRIRIARGTAINLPFLVATAGVYAWRHDHRALVPVALALGVLAIAATMTAGERIKSAWLRNLCEAYRMTAASPNQFEPIADTVVAGVCWRGRADDPEFLLVRTSGGRKWTFPKGHIEDGESPVDAVLREVAEEAGVSGEPDPLLLTTYRYPTPWWKPDRPEEYAVAAYLVRIEDPEQQAVSPERRETKWSRAKKARERLADKREERYAQEHARVLSAARRRLGPG